MGNRLTKTILSLGAAATLGVAAAQDGDIPEPQTEGQTTEYVSETGKTFAKSAGDTVYQKTKGLMDTVFYLPNEVTNVVGGVAGDLFHGIGNILGSAGGLFHGIGNVVEEIPVSLETLTTGVSEATSNIVGAGVQATVETATGHPLTGAGTLLYAVGDSAETAINNSTAAVTGIVHETANGVAEVGAPTVASAIHNTTGAVFGVTTETTGLGSSALGTTANIMNRADAAAHMTLDGDFTHAGREVAGMVTTEPTQLAGNAIRHAANATADVLEAGSNTVTDAVVNMSKPGVKVLAESAAMFTKHAAEQNGVTKSEEDIRQLKETINAGPEIARDVGKTLNAGFADAVRGGGKATDTLVKATGMGIDAAIRGQSEDVVTNAMPRLEETGNDIGAHLVKDTVQNAESIVSRASKVKNVEDAKELAKRVRSEEKRIASQVQNNLHGLDDTLYTANENARNSDEKTTMLGFLAEKGLKVEKNDEDKNIARQLALNSSKEK